jgi:hypothetical protein
VCSAGLRRGEGRVASRWVCGCVCVYVDGCIERGVCEGVIIEAMQKTQTNAGRSRKEMHY